MFCKHYVSKVGYIAQSSFNWKLIVSWQSAIVQVWPSLDNLYLSLDIANFWRWSRISSASHRVCEFLLLSSRSHFGAYSSSLTFMTVGLLGRVISSSQGRYLNTGQHKQKKRIQTHQTSLPCVGFELTIPAFERTKTVHALFFLNSLSGRWSPTGSTRHGGHW
jgi:hypothetical protein